MKSKYAVLVLGTFLTLNLANADMASDKQSIDNACTQEASTAGCGNDQVGTGLLKCIHAYKKANQQTFKISDGCKAAMKQLHVDRKSAKPSGSAPVAQ